MLTADDFDENYEMREKMLYRLWEDVKIGGILQLDPDKYGNIFVRNDDTGEVNSIPIHHFAGVLGDVEVARVNYLEFSNSVRKQKGIS